MACHEIMPGVHVCTGPRMERCKELEEKSAVFCWQCRRRTVQKLVSYFPKMDPDTMREDEMMAASFYGPESYWECKCGGSKRANYEVEW